MTRARINVAAATTLIACDDCGRSFSSRMALGQHRRSTHLNPNWVSSKQKRQMKAAPLCPRCGNRAQLIQTKFGIKATCCGLWSWDFKPLTDRETHKARILAHAAFDAIWKSGEISRGEAYRRLQIAMELPQAECHIAQFTEAQAKRVVELVEAGALAIDPTPREVAA